MTKKAKVITAVVVVGVIAGVALYATFGAKSELNIKTATAGPIDFATTVTGSGVVSASDKYNIEAPTAGTLLTVDVKNGDTVKAGQVLATMDPKPLEVQVKQAQSAVNQAEAALKGLDTAVSAKDLEAAYTAVNVAEEGYNRAKDALANAINLANTPSVPGVPKPTSADIAQLNTATDQALLGLKQAQAALEKAKNPVTSAQRTAAQSGVAAANAGLELANSTLQKASFVSPIDGVVLLNPMGVSPTGSGGTTAQKGSVVTPGAPPFTVVNMGTLNFEAAIDEADIANVETNMSASVVLSSFGKESFESTVTAIAKSSTSTATGGTVYTVTLATNPTTKSFLIGMKGDATIKTKVTNASVAIPIDALFEDGSDQYVYKVENNKLVKQKITTGAITDTVVEVTKGLSSRDVVAIAGSTVFKDGMAVKSSGSVKLGN